MTTIEVMRKALEALEQPNAGLVPHEGEWRSIQSVAIDALRAEIARLEAAEPVAWMYTSRFAGYDRFVTRFQSDLDTYKADKVWPLYTAPIAPSIPALTDDEAAAAFVAAFAAKTAARLPSFDVWANGARWAYDLAAKRAQAMVLGG